MESSQKFWNSKQEVMKLVQENGFCLKNASFRLQDDEEVVKAAVTTNGCALMYASKRLQNDLDIICLATLSDYNAVRYASGDIKSDIASAKRIVSIHPNAIQYFDISIQTNKEILLIAINNIFFEITLFPKIASKDKDTMIYLIEQKPNARYFLDESLREDEDILKLMAILDYQNNEYSDLVRQRNILKAKLSALNSLIFFRDIREIRQGEELNEENKSNCK